MQDKNGHFKTLLKAKQSELTAESEHSKDDREPVELDQSRVGRLSRMDAMQVQAMSNAVDQRRFSHLKRIESALIRMDEGEYGYCLECGEEIALARLELDPATPKCANCANK